MTESRSRTVKGRDFVTLAGEIRSSRTRADLMKPGDFIRMPTGRFAAFYEPVPVDPNEQASLGLVGETVVSIKEIITDPERGISDVVLSGDKDDPETERRPVDASLFYNYGTEGRWPKH